MWTLHWGYKTNLQPGTLCYHSFQKMYTDIFKYETKEVLVYNYFDPAKTALEDTLQLLELIQIWTANSKRSKEFRHYVSLSSSTFFPACLIRPRISKIKWQAAMPCTTHPEIAQEATADIRDFHRLHQGWTTLQQSKNSVNLAVCLLCIFILHGIQWNPEIRTTS